MATTKPKSGQKKSVDATDIDSPLAVIYYTRALCQRCYNEFSPAEVDEDDPRCPICDQSLKM